MGVQDYSTTPASNTTINGIDISEGCNPGNINNAIRQLMADVRAAAIPVGTVQGYAGATAPEGWLLCYGQAVSRTTYADLFTVIGTTYGSGDGSTTFNIPDRRGRVGVGKDNMGGVSANRLTGQSGGVNGDVLGAAGGAETHALTAAQNGPHNHDYFDQRPVNDSNLTQGSDDQYWRATLSTDNRSTGTSGSGSPHNNVQPSIVMNYIIFAGV